MFNPLHHDFIFISNLPEPRMVDMSGVRYPEPRVVDISGVRYKSIGDILKPLQ